MPATLNVEKLRFAFDASWSIAFTYDDTEFYRKGPACLQGTLTKVKMDGTTEAKSQGTKAVDVVALQNTGGLLLLEAKDFRGHRAANQHRVKNGEVCLEVALKVRDTIAGLIGAERTAVRSEFPAAKLSAALKHGNDLTIVLWLEDDTFRDAASAKPTLGMLTNVLKAKLAWLNVRTFVLSSSVANLLPDLAVTNLPGAGRPNP